MTRTRTIRIHATGGPDALRLDSVELAPPSTREVRVAVEACGVNFLDTYHRSGLYPLAQLPHAIGVEAAGTVEAIGEGVTEFAIGDRVAFAGGAPRAYAEACNVEVERVVRVPDGIELETAAASMLQGMTAEYLVDRCACVSAGDSVLVHAAAGGTGQWIVSWLRDRGAKVIAVVGDRAKESVAIAAGATHVIVRREEDIAARARELTSGEGVRVVFDSVGKDTLVASLASLGRRGLLVSFGNASGPPAPLDLLELSRRGSLYVTRPTLFDYIATRPELEAASSTVFDRLARGVITPRIDARLPLAEAAEAHRRLESGGTTGKILLVP